MYNITNESQIDKILINLAGNVPSLFPMLLVFEFMVIALGGAFANQRRVGYTNISMWFAIAGLITSTSAFILFLVNGLITLPTLSICVTITILSVLWFMFSGDEQG
jgi:hypothetical protein